MSDGIAVVIGLLVVVILLIAEKQEDRPRVLGRLVLIGAGVWAIYHIGPILGLLALLFFETKPLWLPPMRFLSSAAPYVFVGFLVGLDVLWAYGLLADWENAKGFWEKFAAVSMGLSAICAVVGFVGFCFGDNSIGGLMGFAVLLAILAARCMPKSTNAAAVQPSDSAAGQP
jgi:hypothetical protein